MAAYRPLPAPEFRASLAAIREATARDRARLAAFDLVRHEDDEPEEEQVGRELALVSWEI